MLENWCLSYKSSFIKTDPMKQSLEHNITTIIDLEDKFNT